MAFVYQSFEGRFSDSPRAIHARLRELRPDARHVWIADPRFDTLFPDDVETVEYRTPEARALLESADALIANTHTDMEWEKPDGTVYLQTWHGTPLKRIHWDVLWAPEGRLDRLQCDVDRWDVLVAPNRYSVDPLRSAFRFDREMIETGYPRNDVLLSPGRDALRDRVRRDLGLPAQATVVLYAPTWRDDVVFGADGGAIELQFDAVSVADALGPDHHVLLRMHDTLTGRLAAPEHPQVHDVSLYPDIAELYLAADVLITDYSSAMFDFAVTGRPQLFFTYDLDDYRDRVRGFYFDFVPEAPGPLLGTTPEIIDALRRLPEVTEEHAARYAAFRERFCHLEDGQATERVVRCLLDRVSSR